MTRLWVFAKDGVIIRRPWLFHRADANAIHVTGQQTSADNPIGFTGELLKPILLDQRTEHIRHGFVQRAWLLKIL